MKRKRLFRITLTDENSLEQRGRWLATPGQIGLSIAGVVVILLAAGVAIAGFTPLRRLMPGYLRSEQRAATEMAFLRIDSLRQVVETEREYMANMISALDTRRTPDPKPDTIWWQQEAEAIFPADSLLMPSERETSFNLALQRREGFNLSVLAPLAAEGMLFCFPASQGVYGPLGADGATQRVILSRNACVRSVADGTVVGVTRSVRERGYLIWIQHDNGFLSRYSRLGSPLVDQGSRVETGEAIALMATGTGMHGEWIDVQLWHDGEQLPPRRFLPDPL